MKYIKKYPFLLIIFAILTFSLIGCNQNTRELDLSNKSTDLSITVDNTNLSQDNTPKTTVIDSMMDIDTTYDDANSFTEEALDANETISQFSVPSTSTKEDETLTTTTKEKRMVAIDAGHQRKGNSKLEPIGPGAKTKKAKVTSGTTGVATGVPEYKLTLQISLKLKKALTDLGYDVFMIRETHDVDISNKERADLANESGADIFIRIHADGSTNSSVNGASTLCPSPKNPYVANLSKSSKLLSKAIVDGISNRTGGKNRGAIERDDMSGINWSQIPVSIIEMGYMSNPKEDKLMQTKDYQNKIVKGIVDGIEKYFKDIE